VNDNAAQDDVIALLSDPGSYGYNVQTIERHETHGAVVFLAGERAYKLKRAVKFPYMDYSTVERRRRMCMREFEINRRMAPELYLEVRPIVRDSASLRFGHPDESANAVDWVLVMRRFDQSALLETIRRSGGLTTTLMRLVAEALARVHAGAEVTRDFGGEAGIRDVVANNVALLKARVGRPFSKATVQTYESAASSALGRVAALLEERRNAGQVRRCHGDLHLNNIFVQDGVPVLFDAIEFNDRFACIDVLYDLSFLLMDLDRHGLREHANAVFNRYLELAAQHSGIAAMPLFLSCRAAIRAHTAVATAEAIADEDRRRALLNDASALLERAVEYLADPKPRLVAVGGVSGTGKSTLAYGLAPSFGGCPGAVVIRSDVVRKQLMGVADTVRLSESNYTPEMSKRVYARVAEIASETLASGFTAIADAVYGQEEERDAIAEVARRAQARFDGLWLEAPRAVLERRIAARVGDASDATADVLRFQLDRITRPLAWRAVSAAGSAANSLEQARRSLGPL
jgi:aminoglycoside phosphotransferase family enzyme/predicted kinase